MPVSLDLLFKRSKEVQKARLKMEFKLNFNSPSSYLTIESGVSMWAGALVGAVAVLAGAAIQAGFRVALVDVMLAVATSEAWRA